MPCDLGPGKEKGGGGLSPPPPDIVRARGLAASNAGQAAQALARCFALPFFAFALSAAEATSISSIEPPAASTAWRAPAEAPATRKASLDERLPLPSRRTPSLPPRDRP